MGPSTILHVFIKYRLKVVCMTKGPARAGPIYGISNLSRKRLLLTLFVLLVTSCAPTLLEMQSIQGTVGETVRVPIKYLVGWPRIEIGDQTLIWSDLKLISLDPNRRDVPGEELVWIEDKILQFSIPDVAPGTYAVTVHDDKGPPGDTIYSILETTAYIIFPPVWPFIFRSNQTKFHLTVLSPP
jgi:hypothetical protein